MFWVVFVFFFLIFACKLFSVPLFKHFCQQLILSTALLKVMVVSLVDLKTIQFFRWIDILNFYGFVFLFFLIFQQYHLIYAVFVWENLDLGEGPPSVFFRQVAVVDVCWTCSYFPVLSVWSYLINLVFGTKRFTTRAVWKAFQASYINMNPLNSEGQILVPASVFKHLCFRI